MRGLGEFWGLDGSWQPCQPQRECSLAHSQGRQHYSSHRELHVWRARNDQVVLVFCELVHLLALNLIGGQQYSVGQIFASPIFKWNDAKATTTRWQTMMPEHFITSALQVKYCVLLCGDDIDPHVRQIYLFDDQKFLFNIWSKVVKAASGALAMLTSASNKICNKVFPSYLYL